MCAVMVTFKNALMNYFQKQIVQKENIWYNLYRQPCTRWLAPYNDKKGVVLMSTYEIINLLISFGLLIVALLAYLDKKHKR